MEIIPIAQYNYTLPEERIAKFPLAERDASKLLVLRNGVINERCFREVGAELDAGTILVSNNTRVVRARLIMHKPTGGQVEVFCLEPSKPADYERAFAAREVCEWHCIIGGARRWREQVAVIAFEYEEMPYTLTARRADDDRINFEWDAPLSFGQLLELLGQVPIPPYLRRDSEAIDDERYQTVYARWEGSVAAPTAGLHFTEELIDSLKAGGVDFEEVTLHVGAGTFLPVKGEDAAMHDMHTEHFSITLASLLNIIAHKEIVAVGTTSVRVLESLPVLGWRIYRNGAPRVDEPIGQWEAYDIPDDADGLLEVLAEWMNTNNTAILNASTRIMIRPPFHWRVISGIITNFHQPRSTLLLLVAALIGEHWHEVYDYALAHDFRFLSYGDSSLLKP